MIVGAQEVVDALRAVAHVGVGGARRIVPVIVLARRVERREVGVDVAGAGRRATGMIGGAERRRRRAGERSAHQRDRTEYVGPCQRAVGCNRRAEVVPDHGRDRAAAERRHEPQGVAHQVEDAEGREVAVVVAVPTRGATITPLVGRDHVKPRCRQRQHHLAPAVRQLREAVQQQNAGAAHILEARLQDVHRESVAVLHETGAYAGRKRGAVRHRCRTRARDPVSSFARAHEEPPSPFGGGIASAFSIAGLRARSRLSGVIGPTSLKAMRPSRSTTNVSGTP